ncbi:hypothetical protein VTI28DRAFT_3086 [Corynascus sepedonium]
MTNCKRSDNVSVTQVSTPASRTSTRLSTAGKTTSTTTSAFSRRARTSPLAASSGSPTGPCAPADGMSGGMRRERLAIFPLSWISKVHFEGSCQAGGCSIWTML